MRGREERRSGEGSGLVSLYYFAWVNVNTGVSKAEES